LTFEAGKAEVARRILKEIGARLGFLSNVGLDYLSLDRPASTLSGGEAERIRLATQIGAGLTGVLYVLDEPSIGLHPRDNERLIATLHALRDLGNTVLVVEHDAETILAADYVVDMGPGAGKQGGRVVAQGSPAALMADPASLTGRYLAGHRGMPLPTRRRRGVGEIVVRGARTHNLRDVTVRFPLGTLTCVTGVSGSGKSSLVMDTLLAAARARLHGARGEPSSAVVLGLEKIDKVIPIDQSPIGRSPRSNPATYTGLFTYVRDLYASLPEARARGYKAGRFSFNVKGGRCEACQGDGVLRIEMHFLPDVFVTCEACGGKRYNRETLEIRYRGKNIADLLATPIEEAAELLGNVPKIATPLRALVQVGLGYVELGQSATTLSGGEAQRVKLARELAKKATGKTLYVLDEPTTGLHFRDVEVLVGVLQDLVAQGNTVLVIEHNLDVIAMADHVIDMGPEGGAGGGRVVATGTPEEIARVAESHTGRFLARELGRRRGATGPGPSVRGP
jgi:excinuclease ABC subunit A